MGSAGSGGSHVQPNLMTCNSYIDGTHKGVALPIAFKNGDRLSFAFNYKKKTVRIWHNDSEHIGAYNPFTTHSAICPALTSATTVGTHKIAIKELDYDALVKGKRKKGKKKKKHKKKTASMRPPVSDSDDSHMTDSF